MVMKNRENYMLEHPEDRKYKITETNDKYFASICIPIISDGDSIGTVIFFDAKEVKVMGDVEYKLAITAANFLGKQMED